MLFVFSVSIIIEFIKMSMSMDSEWIVRYLGPVYIIILNSICFIISFILLVLIVLRLAQKGNSKQLR